MQQLFEWIDNDKYSIYEMSKRIDAGEHFAFARYGDGEFDAMVGNPTVWQHGKNSNCDAHEYFPDMGKALRECLIEWKDAQDENYFIGMHYSKRIGNHTYNWLKKNGFDTNRKFANNSVFHDALVNGSIEMIYPALGNKEVVLVGPKRLKVQDKVKVIDFVEVPETNSWTASDKIVSKLLSLDLSGKVVLFCSGPPTGVFIHRVWQERKDVTLIDFGSTLDPTIGVHSRNFHRKLNL